jgi:dienelactone hydrolase
MRAIAVALILLVLDPIWVAKAQEEGPGREIALIGTEPLVIYTYRPAPCREPKLLLVFAGYNRDADRYRDHARGIAERACLWVISPLFDRERFPTWRYQRGGVTRDGKPMPQSEWTGPLLADLIAWARSWAGQPHMAYIMFGHSAGAQFLSRVAAYSPPSGLKRIVIANPSAHVWPSVDEAAPYGFAGIFDDETREMKLRAYLALPLTIYLGAADTDDRLLVKDEPAMRQGENRHERGLNVYRAASRLARERSWTFGWTLVEVARAGHSASRMLDAAEATEALGLAAAEPVR